MNVRDQLLVAAAQVYAEGGYHGATTRRIASAAGVNEITLFRHFGSKETLLREALARCQAESATPLPEEPRDPVSELTDWSRSHLRDLQVRAPLIRTCLGEFAERPDLVTPEISCPVRAVRALAAYLARLKQRKLAAISFDERVAATMLVGVLFSDAVGRDLVPDMYSGDPDEALTEYVALFLRGIGVDTSGDRGGA
ncbi:MAG: TetR/AcrR family transcriptional regulator [Gemmatimonadales bacterium]|nr:TetR/AcrR family transcriptional regulator [Gemmatimonadales bacterium]